ncbi:putative outer membrane lipoprotein [Desulfohalotomaculum tongense]|uniref:anti sigma factor C-terminal domain-containing protein n=1 Tax=Desulforadius tongensis TaxID=1216062 RepID=UPI0019561A65|nr:anti sigma factor C-terminal domain-containing protein [Desulforadius tongensis]MBM7853905.1 putative outer membrane lipoprotein [Desulforadius tongensis]
MNDEKKLTDTFDFNSNETKKILQKAKLFTLLRTTAVSLLVFLLLSAAFVIINAVMLNRTANNELASEQNFDLVARPNTYMSQYQTNDGFLTGELEYVTHRIVGSRPVYNGTYKIQYHIIPIVPGISGHSARGQLTQIAAEDEYSYYNRVGNREMKFYHPYIEYKTYQNDLAMLEEIGEDKYLEMALSFDRDYSLEEVQAMLPGEVKTVWYWVNTYNEEDLNKMKGRYEKLIGNDGQKTGEKVYQEPSILFANEVYGMKGVTSQGITIEDPRRSFINAINFGLNQKNRYQPQFQRLYDRLSNDKGKITKDDIRVIGVVVTGDTASMKLLRNENYIKAAALGIVIDKF